MADPFSSLGFVEEKPAVAAAGGFDALGFQPDTAGASQAEVRAADTSAAPLSPMAAFAVREQAFENAMKRFTSETGGGLKPGQTILQAVTEWSGVPNPAPDRSMAEIEELAQGGKLQYGNSVPYAAAKTLASMGGYAYGGPFAASSAEALVRYVALGSNLRKALDAGAITDERAAEVLAKEMATGFAEDLTWNTAVPLLGQLLKQVPGLRGVIAKVAGKLNLNPGAAPDADLVAQRAAKVAARVKDAQTPPAKQAVEELSARISPQVLTPGQVAGKASLAEQTARISGEEKFAAQHEAVKGAAEGMRGAVMAPAGQPTREAIGTTIQNLAEESQKAMKQRLRPVFKAADASGVKVDFSDVLNRAKAALAADAAIPGGRLAAPERAALSELVDDLGKLAAPAKPAGAVSSGLMDASGKPIMKPTPAVAGTPPIVGAEQALDFISRQKEKLRATTADWKPSAFYETIVGGMTRSADDAFETAAKASGGQAGADLVDMLRSAQGQYRDMMSTVYDDAVKQALKKNPEDVGRLFWQRGNVSEPQQLQRLLALARREGKLTAEESKGLTQAMTRGFLQEAVPNVEAAAKWSTMLREKPGLRDTWKVLTSAPGGAELRGAMEVLEEAAKIAQPGTSDLVGQLGMMAIPFRRAAGLGLGVSWVTGVISPGMLAVGLSVDAVTRLMATAYTQGNKGILNMVMRTLRANNAGTAAGIQAMRAALPVLEAYAAEQGITDLFVSASSEGRASEPDPLSAAARAVPQ